METKETTGELPAAMRAMDLKTGKSPVLLKNVDLGGGAYNSVSMVSQITTTSLRNVTKNFSTDAYNTIAARKQFWKSWQAYQDQCQLLLGAKLSG